MMRLWRRFTNWRRAPSDASDPERAESPAFASGTPAFASDLGLDKLRLNDSPWCDKSDREIPATQLWRVKAPSAAVPAPSAAVPAPPPRPRARDDKRKTAEKHAPAEKKPRLAGTSGSG